MIITTGSTSQSVTFEIVDDSGLSVSALTATEIPTITYQKSGANAAVVIPLTDVTVSDPWTAGGVVSLGGGRYRLDVPDDLARTACRVAIIGDATDKHVLCATIDVFTGSGPGEEHAATYALTPNTYTFTGSTRARVGQLVLLTGPPSIYASNIYVVSIVDFQPSMTGTVSFTVDQLGLFADGAAVTVVALNQFMPLTATQTSAAVDQSSLAGLFVLATGAVIYHDDAGDIYYELTSGVTVDSWLGRQVLIEGTTTAGQFFWALSAISSVWHEPELFTLSPALPDMPVGARRTYYILGAMGAQIAISGNKPAPLTAAETATAVLDAQLSAHQVSGSLAEAVAHSGGNGDGDTPVDHNTGSNGATSVDAMRLLLPDGSGADNAVIKAYLTSEYSTGIRTLRGYSVTGSDGRWLTPLMLNAGLNYTLVVVVPGITRTKILTVTPQ